MKTYTHKWGCPVGSLDIPYFPAGKPTCQTCIVKCNNSLPLAGVKYLISTIILPYAKEKIITPNIMGVNQGWVGWSINKQSDGYKCDDVNLDVKCYSSESTDE